MIVVPDAENHTIVSSFVCTKHRNVTDGQRERQTDGQTARSYYSGLHCEQCGQNTKIFEKLSQNFFISLVTTALEVFHKGENKTSWIIKNR